VPKYLRLLFCFGILILAVAVSSPASADKRVALVIGNSAYQNAPMLRNPRNDATDIGSALKALGFQVIVGLDLTNVMMQKTVREFAEALVGADVGLFFYAGHGLQVAGQNYLVPIDAQLRHESDLDFEAMRAELVLRQMERETKTNIVFLDACRDNPLARKLARSMGTRSASIGRGLAQIESGIGTYIGFATQPNNTALDGHGRNSPFSSALVKHIGDPGVDLTSIMITVRKEVLRSTDGKQVPWEHSSMTAQFYFKPGSVAVAAPSSSAKDREIAALRERLAKIESTLAKREQAPKTSVTPPPAQPAKPREPSSDLFATRPPENDTNLFEPAPAKPPKTTSTNKPTRGGALAIGRCGAYGYSYNYSTRKAADARALKECPEKDCKIVTNFSGLCMAFATDTSKSCGAWGWATRPTRALAESVAVTQCKNAGGQSCRVRAQACDVSPAPAMTTNWRSSSLSLQACKDRAAQKMRNGGLIKNLEVMTQSVFGEEGDYTAQIRCVPDKKIVFFAVVGPKLDRAREHLKALFENF